MSSMGTDEHLRLFKCLVDTSADVLRSVAEKRLLKNNSISMDQFLETNKHFFYHQFEKQTPCCGQFHSCSIKGHMDKQIFNKVYGKNGEFDTSTCLDRFVPKNVSVDNLDLSDLNFFLWNKGSLSSQDQKYIQYIMSVRSEICHPPSTETYSKPEFTKMWKSLGDATEHFAEPQRYKKMVTMQIQTLKTAQLSQVDTDQLLQRMENIKQEIKTTADETCNHTSKKIELVISSQNECSKAIIHQTKTATEKAVTSSEQNVRQHSTKCQENIQRTVEAQTTKIQIQFDSTEGNIKDHISEEFKGFRDSQNNVCKLDRCIESNVLSVCNHIEFSERKIAQGIDNVSQLQGECHKAIMDTLTDTNKRNQNHSKVVQNHLTKQQRDIIEMKENIDYLTKVHEKTIGIIGNLLIKVSANVLQKDALTTTEIGDRQIVLVSKLNSDCMNDGNETLVIKSLPSEIDLESNADLNKPLLKPIIVESKRKGSIILGLKMMAETFQSSTNLRSALMVLVQKILEIGAIDTDIEATVHLNLDIESELTKHEIDVMIDLIGQEYEDKSKMMILSLQKEPGKTTNQTIIKNKHESKSAGKRKKEEMKMSTSMACWQCTIKDEKIADLNKEINQLNEELEVQRFQYSFLKNTKSKDRFKRGHFVGTDSAYGSKNPSKKYNDGNLDQAEGEETNAFPETLYDKSDFDVMDYSDEEKPNAFHGEYKGEGINPKGSDDEISSGIDGSDDDDGIYDNEIHSKEDESEAQSC